MKNIYQNVVKKLLKALKSLKTLISSWLNTLKKDFYFYNSHTELLAIWTVLFLTITGLFTLGIKSKITTVLLLLVVSFVITLVTVFLTTYYLHAIKYHHKKRLLPKTHNFLNKSFKLRTLLRFIKIPYASFFLSKFKNFKHLIKRDFKFAS